MVVISYFCRMDNATSLTMPADIKLSFDKFREEVLADFRIACISREASLLARKEVLTASPLTRGPHLQSTPAAARVQTGGV